MRSLLVCDLSLRSIFWNVQSNIEVNKLKYNEPQKQKKLPILYIHPHTVIYAAVKVLSQ